jgi:hypothetical protein
VVQDETNTIPVLSTTGIRFSSADPGISFSVGDVMKSRCLVFCSAPVLLFIRMIKS